MISERPLEETLGEDTKQNKGIGIRCFAAEPQAYVTADEDARVLKKIDRWYRLWSLFLANTDAQIALCPSCL